MSEKNDNGEHRDYENGIEREFADNNCRGSRFDARIVYEHMKKDVIHPIPPWFEPVGVDFGDLVIHGNPIGAPGASTKKEKVMNDEDIFVRPLIIFGGSVGKDLKMDLDLGLAWWGANGLGNDPAQEKGGGLAGIKVGEREGTGQSHRVGFPPPPPTPPPAPARTQIPGNARSHLHPLALPNDRPSHLLLHH